MALFESLQPAPLEAQTILQNAIRLYRPSAVYALFSGGHDSLCAAYIASQVGGFAGAVHICTGIGIPDTTAYVQETCAQQGWPLQIYHPPTSYEVLVLRYGFPGPPMHRVMYHALKERCLRQLMRQQSLPHQCRVCGKSSQGHRQANHDFDPPRILLVSGVRLEESQRRMGHARPSEPDPRDQRRVWCAPLLTWTSTEKNAFIAAKNLPRNPVVDKLCMSGECLCGAYASENEIREIERWYPDVATRIHELERQTRILGKPCIWGKAAPRDTRESPESSLFTLCWSCDNKPKTYGEAL